MDDYVVRGRCGNCGKQDLYRIPTGTDKEVWKKTAKCSKCEVQNTLTLSTIEK
ncbi:MAG: hypothetical protein ACREBB_06660 [Nitrosotalea sp.]